MRRHTRPAALLASLALAGSGLLASAGAASAAPGDPVVLTVNVVDQYGRPTPSLVQTFASDDGDYKDETGGMQALPSHTFSVPGGEGYSFTVISAWSGVDCFGVTPCAANGTSTYSAAVTVPDGVPTVFTARVTVPTISGGTAVGAPLTVQMPEGIQRLNAAIAASSPPYNTLSTVIGQQWTRGGVDIPAATGTSYVTTRADGGQAVALKLSPSQAITAVLGQAGATAPTFTTNSINVVKPVPVATKTKVKVAKRFSAKEKVTMTIKVKAAAGVPDGKVTVSIDKFKKSATLDDGEVLFNLPRLAPGTYKVKVTYAGSEDFVKSKSKKVTLTVTK